LTFIMLESAHVSKIQRGRVPGIAIPGTTGTGRVALKSQMHLCSIQRVNRNLRIFYLLILIAQVIALPYGRSRTVYHDQTQATHAAPVFADLHGHPHFHGNHLHGFPEVLLTDKGHIPASPDHSHLREPDVFQRECRSRLSPDQAQPALAFAWLPISILPGQGAIMSLAVLHDMRRRLPAPVPLSGRTCNLLL
jgi:hypothetical protein